MTWPVRVVPLALLLVATACPRDEGARPETPMVRVRSFSEPSPVRAVAALRPYVFTGTDYGLDRWNLDTGKALSLTAEHGLPADRIVALALDEPRQWLWIATDNGVAKYDIGGGVFEPVPPAPTDALTALSRKVDALAASGAGGVWIGGERGLAHADARKGWRPARMDAPVTALLLDRAGNLWIGTPDEGLHVRRADGSFATLGPAQHCELERVGFIVEAPDGAPLVVGDNAAGDQRIARVRADGEGCVTFRVSPDEPWTAASRRGNETIIASRRGLYELSMPRRGARRLRRDGMRLVATASGPNPNDATSPYVIRSLGVRTPVGSGALAVAGDEVMVGTRELGTARIELNPRGPKASWLRRSALSGAGPLSVACRVPDDCIVVTGPGEAWRFDGGAFSPIAIDVGQIMAVKRHPDGELYAIYRRGDEGRIRLARMRGMVAEELGGILIETPGEAADIEFADISPRGALWLGLTYADEAGDRRSYGVAEIELELGVVAYHHASRDRADLEQGILPIPRTANDIAFLGEDEVWLASHEGAVRIQGREVEVFGEAQGLLSELMRSVAVTSGGVVFVASRVGVGVYDGTAWSYPRALRRSVNSIDIGKDGRLWMATPRGVAAYDGARVRRLDSRRGLLDDRIADIDIDRYGRVWALSREGLSIVTP